MQSMLIANSQQNPSIQSNTTHPSSTAITHHRLALHLLLLLLLLLRHHIRVRVLRPHISRPISTHAHHRRETILWVKPGLGHYGTGRHLELLRGVYHWVSMQGLVVLGHLG